jgi:hypothetical protein
MTSAVFMPGSVNSTHVRRGGSMYLAFSTSRVVVGVVRVVFPNGAEVGERDPESLGHP